MPTATRHPADALAVSDRTPSLTVTRTPLCPHCSSEAIVMAPGPMFVDARGMIRVAITSDDPNAIPGAPFDSGCPHCPRCRSAALVTLGRIFADQRGVRHAYRCEACAAEFWLTRPIEQRYRPWD